MKRRNFLKIATAATLATSINGFPVGVFGAKSSPLLKALGAQDLNNDNVLVLVQLNGGNDGLNTVIPLEFYDNYQAARSNIAIPEPSVLGLPGITTTGLHPVMDKFQTLFQEESLGIIQSVGYPNPSFSHFRATDIWMSGSNSDDYETTGWGGRFLDDTFPGFPQDYPNMDMPDPLAIQIGSVASLTCMGPSINMAMSITDPTNFYNLLNGDTGPAPNTNAGKELTFLRTTTQQTNAYAQQITNAANMVTTQYSGYPAGNRLADQLKIVARLIKGGLKTRVYMVSLGGFDTHSLQTQGNTTTGAHADLLSTLSEAVFAFQRDCEFLSIDHKVLGMTYSEFGRRIASNGSTGTDHGAAGPMFLFGTNASSQVLGDNPVISNNVASNESIPFQFDFRSVYASILEQWFCVDEQVVASYFPNINYPLQTLPIVENASCPVIAISPKVFLSETYAGNDSMAADLGTTIPTNHPYTVSPWNYTGTETVEEYVLQRTGDQAVVDWVYVELRDKASNTSIVGQRAALLLANGKVVATDGISPVTFRGLAPDDYFVAIHHRNHHAAMTLASHSISSVVTRIDFTTVPTYGTNAQKSIGGIFALWGGDSDGNGIIDATDRALSWNQRNMTGYLNEDLNLDGVVDAEERSITWNHKNKLEQLP